MTSKYEAMREALEAYDSAARLGGSLALGARSIELLERARAALSMLDDAPVASARTDAINECADLVRQMRNSIGELSHRASAMKDACEQIEAALRKRAGHPAPIRHAEPGTTQYGSMINRAAQEADQCFSIGKDRFKWLCRFEQSFRAAQREEVR